ncbi:GNAT family N-acetyltransferase [Rummeliibacillus suwonensis]|uniref:GNAT family N-acetyltransferase n=1 Tax=Rummeliibacillus suwonensis TaxID=1306154 RepID=UPI001FBB247D|nr:GNAT family N-acetyltransferase [Rummeliibacillus suwonensis]
MLQTERLKLRDYRDMDLPFLSSLLVDERMMKYIGNGKTRNAEEARDFLNWIYASYAIHPDYGLKIIEWKEERKPIGHAGLVPQEIKGKQRIEIGYWIAPAYWGKGFATEIAQALKEYGENNLQLHQMIALIQMGNLASQKVAIHIGMTKEREIERKGKRVNIFSTDDKLF